MCRHCTVVSSVATQCQTRCQHTVNICGTLTIIIISVALVSTCTELTMHSLNSLFSLCQHCESVANNLSVHTLMLDHCGSLCEHTLSHTGNTSTMWTHHVTPSHTVAHTVGPLIWYHSVYTLRLDNREFGKPLQQCRCEDTVWTICPNRVNYSQHYGHVQCGKFMCSKVFSPDLRQY